VVKGNLYNAISAITNRGEFWYHVYSGRFNTDKFIDCLKALMKYRKRPVYIITDGHPVHKAKRVKKYINDLEGKLSVYILPLMHLI
jgi:hypothetical protein